MRRASGVLPSGIASPFGPREWIAARVVVNCERAGFLCAGWSIAAVVVERRAGAVVDGAWEGFLVGEVCCVRFWQLLGYSFVFLARGLVCKAFCWLSSRFLFNWRRGPRFLHS